MYCFDHKKLNANFERLKILSILYFEGFIGEEGTEPDYSLKELKGMVLILKEAMLDALVIRTLALFDYDDRACSLITAYRHYSSLFSSEFGAALNKKEDMKYFLGNEGYGSYERLKFLRDKVIAHNEKTDQLIKATHKDLKVLEILFDEKLKRLVNRIKEDVLPSEIQEKERIKVAKEFWNQVCQIMCEPTEFDTSCLQTNVIRFDLFATSPI